MLRLSALLLALCATAQAQRADWTFIEAGGDTRCALNTPYGFFHRPGTDPDRLLVYFQGGGACWDWVSCSGMFDPSVERSEIAAFRGGIFDTETPANPFREHGVLFVPYCTGDLHVGDAEVRYGDDPEAAPVAHNGARNVEAALRWAADRLGEPRQVVVAGASAGAYAALYYTPRVAARYPEADLVTIADSGVPLLQDYEAILDRWGAGPVLREIWGAEADAPLALERAYREAAASGRAVAVVTSDRDAVQSAFYLISGSPAAREATYALLDRAEVESPGVRTFVVAGTDHGLLRTDAFYEYAASGTSLAPWVGRLVGGVAVESVRCAVCAVE